MKTAVSKAELSDDTTAAQTVGSMVVQTAVHWVEWMAAKSAAWRAAQSAD